MRGQIKLTTGFPSAAKAAKNLGVSKRVARDLSLLAERSLRTGEYVLPGRWPASGCRPRDLCPPPIQSSQ